MSTSTILPVIHPVQRDNLHFESLDALHTAIVDALNEIEHLGRNADESMAPVLEAFRELHESHRRDLAADMAGQGHPPEQESAMHDLFQSGKEQLRDLVAPPEDQALRQLVENEREVIAAYNGALEAGGPAGTIALLQHQREELGALVVKHDARLE